MKKLLSFLVLASVFVSGGCHFGKKDPLPQTLSNVIVTTSSSPAAQFPTGSKYAFVAFAEDQEQSDEAGQVDQRIQNALSAELKRKGFRPGSYTDINFFVAYTYGLQQQVDVLVAKSKEQGNEWISIVVAAKDYVNGAMLVQVIDARSMEPVWLGVFNADIQLASVDEQTKQERVGYAVRQLLQTFPQK